MKDNKFSKIITYIVTLIAVIGIILLVRVLMAMSTLTSKMIPITAINVTMYVIIFENLLSFIIKLFFILYQ